MGKYLLTYACGHSGNAEIYGSRRDKEWRMKRLEEDECPNCRAKKENKKNVAVEEEYDLPPLIGSDKQISWGRSIRASIFQGFETCDIDTETRVNTIQYLGRMVSAHWWIDNRERSVASLARTYGNELENEDLPIAKEPPRADHRIVGPEKEVTKEVAYIFNWGGAVAVHSQKDDTIIDTVKQYNFVWDKSSGDWKLKMTVMEGDAEDRVAEIGNALLNAGVRVYIENDDTREKAVNGTFKPRDFRWVVKHSEEKVKIYFENDNEDLYTLADLLPKSYYKDRGFIVRAKYYEDIRDFAESNSFHIAEDADELMKQYDEMEKHIKRVKPVEVERKLLPVKNIKDIMKSEKGIIDDLKDD